MFDFVLLVVTSIFLGIMLTYVGVNVYKARNSRPVRIVLNRSNSAEPASTVDLTPYVSIISGKFPETLDE